MKVTYVIHHQHLPDRTVTVSDDDKTGRDVIEYFRDAKALRVGAVYAGCEIVSIEDSDE